MCFHLYFSLNSLFFPSRPLTVPLFSSGSITGIISLAFRQHGSGISFFVMTGAVLKHFIFISALQLWSRGLCLWIKNSPNSPWGSHSAVNRGDPSNKASTYGWTHANAPLSTRLRHTTKENCLKVKCGAKLLSDNLHLYWAKKNKKTHWNPHCVRSSFIRLHRFRLSAVSETSSVFKTATNQLSLSNPPRCVDMQNVRFSLELS